MRHEPVAWQGGSVFQSLLYVLRNAYAHVRTVPLEVLVHLPAQYLDLLNQSCLYRGTTKKDGSNRTRRAIYCGYTPQRDIIDFKGSVTKLLQLHFWSTTNRTCFIFIDRSEQMYRFRAFQCLFIKLKFRPDGTRQKSGKGKFSSE